MKEYGYILTPTVHSIQGKIIMAAVSYTEFPALFHFNHPRGEREVAETRVELATEISPDRLTISWAILLHSYTEETTPIFKSNGRSVAVDVREWATYSVQEVTGVQGSRFTGITSEDVGFSHS
jgi:hypothetical protein